MKKALSWLAIIALVAGTAAVVYVVQRGPQLPPAVPLSTETRPLPEDNRQPLRRYPVPESPTTGGAAPASEEDLLPEPLPRLQESDTAVQKTLENLFGQAKVGELFILKNIIRRLVVTIDNLPRNKLPLDSLPAKGPGGPFIVRQESPDEQYISPENYRRYTRYVQLAESVDTQKLVSAYFRYYTLFQETYAELGYSSAYFNDRLVQVIDHLLQTPVIADPIRLTQPSVFHTFADPQLESLSAGQKILVRMGNDNAARIKAKLRDIRREVTKQTRSN